MDIYKIVELWVDKYGTLAQSIMYFVDDIYKPDINPNLCILKHKWYYDKNNNLVKEELYSKDGSRPIATMEHNSKNKED